MPIPYGRQALDDHDVAAVNAVLRGDWLTQGPHVDAFERTVAETCETPYAVAFSSGTAALHAAAFAAGVGSDAELITSPITFAASANCAAYLGGTPLFADIDPQTWNMAPDAVRDALSPRTRAVIPVHFAGLPVRVEEIRHVVGDEVTIIEDAAHALGASDGPHPVGSCQHSDMAVFSFHPVKAVTAAEGGIVTTRDAEHHEQLWSFRNHGFVRDPDRLRHSGQGGWYYEQQALGFNYRLSDVHSALGNSQMAKLEPFIERRGGIAERYREQLGDLAQLELPPSAPAGSRHAYHLFVIRHREGSKARLRLYDGLRERGIGAQVHYIPVYHHPWYRAEYGYEPGLCPEAERYYEGCLSLPCFPGLSAVDQATVIDAVREFS